MRSLNAACRLRLPSAAAVALLLLGAAACTGTEQTAPQSDPPPVPAPNTQPTEAAAPEPTSSLEPTSDATAPAPGEAPEAGGVEAWALQALGRDRGVYYGNGWMGTAGTHTADAPVAAGSYGVTLACRGDGPVEVVISEGEDAPAEAEPSSASVDCERTKTVAFELETEGMQLEFTMPDGIHLYGYKIFERP